jgi:hypothetical protein
LAWFGFCNVETGWFFFLIDNVLWDQDDMKGIEMFELSDRKSTKNNIPPLYFPTLGHQAL